MISVSKSKHLKTSRFRNASTTRASSIRPFVVTDNPAVKNVLTITRVEFTLRPWKKLPVVRIAIWNIQLATGCTVQTAYVQQLRSRKSQNIRTKNQLVNCNSTSYPNLPRPLLSPELAPNSSTLPS